MQDERNLNLKEKHNQEMQPHQIMELLEDYYRRDMHYEDGHILGSMYTKPPDIVLQAFFKFYQANLGNIGLYPGTAEMEREVVKFLLRLTSGKEDYYGHVVSGGTEANIIALWAARNIGFKRILCTMDVHFSIKKAANLLSLPIKEVPMENGRMSSVDLEKIVEPMDIVVATAGTTPLGFIDPIGEIGKICEEHNAYLHVDAAFGGYVIPFLRELGYTDKRFGFDISAVRSVTIDPHKMGLAPYPAGGIVSRENIFERISVDAPYLMEEKSDTLLGTRQSGSVAGAYAAHLYFGWVGYRKIVKKCMNTTHYLVKRVSEEGFELFAKPEMNIVNIPVSNTRRVKKEMYRRGWGISTNPQYSTIRIVVMPHVTPEIIEDFLKDLKNIEKSYG